MAPAAANQTTVLALTLLLVPSVGGSRFAASRASIPTKALAPAKSLAALKSTSKEPIAIGESAKSGSKESIRVAPLDVPPLQVVGGHCDWSAVSKRARTSEPATKGGVAKRAHSTGPMKIAPPPSIDKGKKVVEHLSSTPYNELLNAAEVTLESMPASAAKELCNKMFKGTLDASVPVF